MSWRVEFEADGVWAVAGSVRDRIADAIRSGELSANETDVERVRELVARVLAQRDDPFVTITGRSLGKVADALQQIFLGLPEIAVAFAARRNAGAAGLPMFDIIANEVRTWPQSGKGKLSGLGNQVAALEATTVAELNHVHEELDALRATIRSVDTEIQRSTAAQINEVSNAVESAQSRVSQIERDMDRLAETATQQTVRIDEAIRAHQDTFAQAELQRAEQAAEAVNQRRDEWSEELSKSSARVEEHLAAMAEHESKSRKVLEAVGVNSTATDYGRHANEQAKAANSWRRIAATILSLAGLWFVLSSVFPYLHGDGELWEQAVSRLGITAAVAGVGLYAARESSQHRAQERQARHTQLVLTALEPFIANLDAEMAAQIRDEAARALFVTRPDTGDVDESSTDQVFTVVTEMLRKIPDSAK